MKIAELTLISLIILSISIQADENRSLPKVKHMIDTHIHLYDTSRDGGVPWPPEEDTVLYKPHLPKEFQNESKKSGGSEFYNKVYNADRPELFFKATKNRISGNDQFVRIRKDSSWNVPEPELTLFATSNKKIIGLTIGNDMSSRSIDGENPLYLPQAKTYDGCASLGPCLYVLENQEEVNNGLEIKISIERKNKNNIKLKTNPNIG